MIVKDGKSNNNLEIFVNFNTLHFIVLKKEIIEQISDFCKVFIGFPNVPLENEERPNLVWNIQLLAHILNRTEIVQAELHHIQNFSIIRSSEYQIIWPLFAVGTKKKQTSISFWAEILDGLLVFERENLMFAGIVNTTFSPKWSLHQNDLLRYLWGNH